VPASVGPQRKVSCRKTLLYDVLYLLTAVKEPIGQSRDHAPVPLEEQFEGCLISGAHSRHKRIVGWLSRHKLQLCDCCETGESSTFIHSKLIESQIEASKRRHPRGLSLKASTGTAASERARPNDDSN
jgi:hypothetical protein